MDYYTVGRYRPITPQMPFQSPEPSRECHRSPVVPETFPRGEGVLHNDCTIPPDDFFAHAGQLNYVTSITEGDPPMQSPRYCPTGFDQAMPSDYRYVGENPDALFLGPLDIPVRPDFPGYYGKVEISHFREASLGEESPQASWQSSTPDNSSDSDPTHHMTAQKTSDPRFSTPYYSAIGDQELYHPVDSMKALSLRNAHAMERETNFQLRYPQSSPHQSHDPQDFQRRSRFIGRSQGNTHTEMDHNVELLANQDQGQQGIRTAGSTNDWLLQTSPRSAHTYGNSFPRPMQRLVTQSSKK